MKRLAIAAIETVPIRVAFARNLVANRPPLHDGWIELTDRPGLGWELDWDYVERHRIEGASNE